jgi:PEGA domain
MRAPLNQTPIVHPLHAALHHTSQRRTLRILIGVLALLSASAGVAGYSPRVAHAQTTGRLKPLRDELTGEALARYNTGAELYGSGKEHAASARSEFLRSFELSKNPRLLFNVAVCEKDLGRFHKSIAYLEQEVELGKTSLPREELDKARGFADGLRPLVGSLAFNVNIPGATIFVDGEEVGQSPLPPIPMSGEREVRATKAGFDTAVIRVSLAGGSQTIAKLSLEAKEKLTDVEITAGGTPNAVIFIDGVERGPSPYRGQVRVQSDPHVFEARAPGYVSQTRSSVAVEGQSIALTLALSAEERFGRLIVTTTPTGASIELNNKPVGINRWEGPLPIGTTHVVIKKDGYYTRATDIDIVKGATRTVTIQLDERQNLSWVVWGLGALAVVGGGVATAVILSSSKDTPIPGSLRVQQGTPVPAAIRF